MTISKKHSLDPHTGIPDLILVDADKLAEKILEIWDSEGSPELEDALDLIRSCKAHWRSVKI